MCSGNPASSVRRSCTVYIEFDLNSCGVKAGAGQDYTSTLLVKPFLLPPRRVDEGVAVMTMMSTRRLLT